MIVFNVVVFVIFFRFRRFFGSGAASEMWAAARPSSSQLAVASRQIDCKAFSGDASATINSASASSWSSTIESQ